jgi:hypothetical protein
MQTPNRGDLGSRTGARLGKSQTSTDSGQHDRAVVEAEVRRLVHALAPYGVLRRDALQREAGAGRWHEAGFGRAVAAALDAGEIRELPFGFYGLPGADGSDEPPDRAA